MCLILYFIYYILYLNYIYTLCFIKNVCGVCVCIYTHTHTLYEVAIKNLFIYITLFI